MSQNIKPGPNNRVHQEVNSLYDVVRAMPKIELHRHLEGSLRLSTLLDIAREYDIALPEYELEAVRPLVQVMPNEPRTWQNFMSKFGVLRQFFVSAEIIRRIAREAVIDAAEDNVKYLELRFTPKALGNIVQCSAHEVVNWVCQSVQETAAECNIQVRLIVSPNRHESVEDAEEAAQAAIDHRHMGVVAIDIGGKEPGHSIYPFRDVLRRARAAGLYVTLHAGEWAGPESVWDAVSSVTTERIGHGVRVLQDPGVVNVLIERGIVLEVCPSSNVDTGSQPSLQAHPLPVLIGSGLKVTINTDDPLVFNVSLTDELVRAINHFSMSLDDIKQHTLLAAESTFLPDSEKAALVGQFRQWLFP